jgi:Kdo2-lipid IVA lauroyltransferase/acyltransferase
MYWFLRGVAAFIGSLGDKSLDRIANCIAWFVFDVTRLRRKLILGNLTIAFPDMPPAERERVGRESVKNFALTALEILRSRRIDIASTVTLSGDEHVRNALAKRQGVYILCLHMGSWEAMGAACTRYLAPSYVIVKKVGSPSVDRFVNELRRHNGFLTIMRKKKGDGFRAIKDTLARGEIVGFVMDQARPGEPKLPFFGRPAKTNTSFAAIWRRDPSPIVPGYIVRTGVNKHVLTFLPEVTPIVTDDAEADVLRHSTEFNAVVESCVRRAPEHYFWMHNRWK